MYRDNCCKSCCKMGKICSCLKRRMRGMSDKQIEADLKSGKKPVFWVIGGPGSGKGTQCVRLAEKYGLAHLSSGDLLREEVAKGSKLGTKLNEMMLSGQLVPRDIVLDLLKKAMIKAYPDVNGFLIDGYPREVDQGKEFREKIGPCAQILYFECSDETMKKRLLARAQTSGRADDNEETITKRIKVFHDISEAVIKEYQIITATISAERTPDLIFNETCNALEPFLHEHH